MVLEGDRPGEIAREFSGFLFGARCPLASSRGQIDPAHQMERGFGEVVFNTAMTGYQEILTDPSYFGQLIVFTYPHIGNTGINAQDAESERIWCGGVVVHEYCERPSSWRSEQDLESVLSHQGVPGITGVDTRALTRFIRERGATRGLILPAASKAQAQDLFGKLPRFEGRDLVARVTARKAYGWPAVPDARGLLRVAVLDYGLKWNLLRSLATLGCTIEVFPAQTDANAVLDFRPSGVLLSNGPGDPMAVDGAVSVVKTLLGKVPIFGVCMGHQILCLALGARIEKMKFGHHGANHPVWEVLSQKVVISSQNHGYGVIAASLPPTAQVTHWSLNDGTLEGIEVAEQAAFSVQFHPEAAPGPHDSMGLFAKFIALMEKNCRSEAI